MKRETGVTLIETMIAALIAAIISMMSMPLMRDFIPRQALVGRANNIVGMIHRGRDHAIGKKAVLLCAHPGDCSSFRQSNALALIEDNNDNRILDQGDRIIDTLQLPENMTVEWRSFRNKPWLKFSPTAISYYQNGSLRLCSGHLGLRVIVTRIGRPRVDQQGISTDQCSR